MIKVTTKSLNALTMNMTKTEKVKKRSPMTNLFQAEEDSSDRCSKGHGHSSSGCSRQHLQDRHPVQY